jgi:thiamine-monophosphate kinase
MSDLGRLGEDGIIDLFASGGVRPPVVKGIGDDCAVIGTLNGELLLWTADLLMEDVHFRMKTIDAGSLGFKSLAVNLSDIAAMGGSPVAGLLSLSLPSSVGEKWLREFRDGFMRCGAEFDCQIIGGDTCASPDRVGIYVTVIGTAPEEDILMRSGQIDGHDIWISGTPGLSDLGLRLLTEGIETGDENSAAAVSAHLTPQPRLALGKRLARAHLASSCIDTSDGLVRDLGRICGLNRVGAEIHEETLPLPRAIGGFEAPLLECALHGGEDYQLLFTAPTGKRADISAIGDVTRIGSIGSDVDGIVLVRADGEREELLPEGFSHF